MQKELDNGSENRPVNKSEFNQPHIELRSEETDPRFQSEQQRALEVSSCKTNEDIKTEIRGRKRHLSDNSDRNSESSSKDNIIKKEKRIRHSSSTSNSTQPQSVQLSGNPSCSVRSGEDGLQGVVLSISDNSQIENLMKMVQTATASSASSIVSTSVQTATASSALSVVSCSVQTATVSSASSVVVSTSVQTATASSASSIVVSTSAESTIAAGGSSTNPSTASTPLRINTGIMQQNMAQIRSKWRSNFPLSNSFNPVTNSHNTSDNSNSYSHCNIVSRTSALPTVSPSNTGASVDKSTSSFNPVTNGHNTSDNSNSNIVSRTSALPTVSPSNTGGSLDNSDSVRCHQMQDQNRGTQGLGGSHLQEVPKTGESNTESAANGNTLPQLPDAPLQSQTLWSQLSKERQDKVVEARKKCFAWWRQYAHLMRKEDAEEALENILNVRLSSFRSIYTRYSRLISQCITDYQSRQSRQSCQQVPPPRQSTNCTGNIHSQWLATEQHQRSVSSQENRVLTRNSQGVQQHVPGRSEAVLNPVSQHLPNHSRFPLPNQQSSTQASQLQSSQFTHYNVQPGLRNQQPLQTQPQQQWHQLQNQLPRPQSQQAPCQQAAVSSSANRQASYAVCGQQQIYRQTYASQQMQGGQGSSQVHSVPHSSVPSSGPMFSPRGSTNMCQGQQNVSSARMQPPSYQAQTQQRPGHPGCNLPRQPSSIPSGYSTASQSSGVPVGPSRPHHVSFNARNSTGLNNRFPSYIESRQQSNLPSMYPSQPTGQLPRLLSTTQPNATYNVPNQVNLLSGVTVQNGQYLTSTAQRIGYLPNQSVTMNRHHQTGAYQPNIAQRPSVMMGNQNRTVNPVRLRAIDPRNSIPPRPPINEIISRVQSSSACTANISTTLFVNTGTISNASTSNLSSSISFAELVRASAEDISPPIQNTGIAGCRNDVQPIVIVPRDDMPPTPATADSCETDQSAEQDGKETTQISVR